MVDPIFMVPPIYRTVSRKNSSGSWICHWFHKNIRREGCFVEEELTNIDRANPFETITSDELKGQIHESEARLVSRDPQFFENLLAEIENREPRNFLIEDDAEEELDDNTPIFSSGEMVWLRSGGPPMTISRQNSTCLWLCHYFENSILHEDLYSEEELSDMKPGYTVEQGDNEFREAILAEVKREPERFLLLIDEALKNLTNP